MSVPEMVERFRTFRHSRVPVFRVHRDNLVGFVHAEDVLRHIIDGTDLSTLVPDDILHPPVVVPLTKKVDEMFDFFQAKNSRAAAVLNEFGGVEGFVTMEDVLAFIFGQVAGKVQGQEHYRERDENYYEVPGDMRLNDFNNLTNFGIEDPRMTTIGGVAFRHLDRLPRVGDRVTVEGITITVLEMDEHRIDRVRASRGEGAEEAAIGDQSGTDGPDEAATGESSAAGSENPLPAGDGPADAPDGGASQEATVNGGAGVIPASAANETGPDKTEPPRENKALH
jgi:CBS domain containing-hemolysin-like protein